jgi:hypothetical protein
MPSEEVRVVGPLEWVYPVDEVMGVDIELSGQYGVEVMEQLENSYVP